MNKFPVYTLDALLDRPMAEIVFLAEWAAYLHQEAQISNMMAHLSMNLMGGSGNTTSATKHKRGKL
jgi:hypothetical protein